MSNIPISSLPLAITLDGSESVPIVQGGTTKRTTISNLRSNAPILASAVLFTQGGTGAVQVTLDSLLRKTVVTPEMFGAVGDGTTDNTAAIVRLGTYLRSISPAGVHLDFKPGADYFIWPNAAGAPLPVNLLDLTSIVGLTVNFNGAKFTTDNLFTTSTTSTVFFLDHTQDLIVNDPWYVQTGKTTLDPGNGGGLLFAQTSAAPWNRNIIVNNPKQFGGLHGIRFVGYVDGVGIPIDNNVENIQVNNGYFDSVYYPLTCNWAGDNLTGTIATNNCGRTYFPYGVSNHDVTIISNGGGPFNDLNIKAYGMPQLPLRKNTTSGIHVRYKNSGRINATASESLCSLEMAQNPQGVTLPTVTGAADNGSGAIRLTTSSLSAAAMATGQTWYANAVGGVPNATGKWVVTVVNDTHVDLQGSTFAGAYTSGGYMRVPAELSDIHIEFDVNNTSNQQPPAVLTYKLAADGAPEIVACGYTLDNIEITGKLRNYNYGKNAIDLFTNTGGYPGFSVGAWTGETVRNIILRDLVVEGTNSGITIDNAVPVNLIIENVVTTPATVPWTFSVNNSETRIINANGTGIVISRSVVPSDAVANQFVTGLDAFGGLTRAQPSLSNLSGLGTGVAAALGTNTGTAGSIVVLNQGYGTPTFLDLTNATALPTTGLTGTLQAAQEPAHTGDVTNSAGSLAMTLATVNSNVGPFGDGTHVAQVTVNGKGLVTAASSVAITGAAPTGAAGGDLTGTYPNPTLAAVATAGTTGSSTAIPVITIDAKGRTTGITTAAVIAPAGTLTGAALAANVLASSLTSVGTLTGGATGAGFTLNFGTSTLTGTIPNANLANSSITINGTAISLGASGTVAAAAGTLTGATLASNVLASSLTSVGTLTGGATGAGFTVALGTSTITGTLSLTNGGLAAALTANNGGIFYSTASAGAILAGTATARQMLQSGATAAPAWSTATWPATTAVSQLLYSSSANTVAGLATANSSVLVTDSGGVPSLSTTLPNINIGTPTGGVGTNITGLPVSGGLLGTIKPEGRLTLVSGTPVMSSTVTAQTTVYYTPDVGTNVPIYNGTAFVPTAFAEVSQATTDATKSPAAVANNSNYDLFCWIDSGTNRCTRGPAWTGDNARGTGAGTSELQRVNGILTNKVAITNGPAANRGTYVGTIRSNGTATIDFQFGALAAGGTAGSFGVWNMYNRVTVASMSQDTTDSYNVSAIGIANGSAGMRTSFVVGQIEDGFSSNYNVTAVAGGSGAAQAGVSLNSTTAFSGSIGYLSAATTGNMAGFLNALPLLGFNYTSAMEGVSAGTSAFKGDNGDPTHIQNGHAFMSRL